MNGKYLMLGLVLFSILFGAALWYAQVYAFYTRVDGLTEIDAYGDTFPVSDYRGIEASSSPLKLRACFTVDWDYIPSEEFRGVAEPLTAPYWFDCFDAETIAQDLASGAATAIRAAEEESDGVDRYIAQYPDGRAFMWRQLNEKYAK